MQATEQDSQLRSAEAVRSPTQQLAARQPSPIYFAAIFCWTMTAVSAALVAIVRWPLGSPHWFALVKAILLPCAVIACATLFTVRHVERGGAYSLLLVSTAVIFLPCLAWLSVAFADIVIYPLFLGSLTAGILQTASAARAVAAGRWMFAVACGGLAGCGYFLVINSLLLLCAAYQVWRRGTPRDTYYGFLDYVDANSEALSDQQLCARAAPWKIDMVFILTAPTSGRKIQCG